MTCPHCSSGETGRRERRTSLGYRTFVCRACRGLFNERTGTGLNDLRTPHIVLMAVLWRLRYKLGFQDVAGLLLQRRYEVTHETIRGWEFRFAPLLAEQSHRAVKQRYHPDARVREFRGSVALLCRVR